MRCWHEETVVHTSTEGEGNTTTRVETVQVTTHTATQGWDVGRWSDESPPASTLHYLDVLKMARLRTHKQFAFMPAAHMRKRSAESSFISANSRDVHNDFSCHMDIPHQSEFCLVYNP